MADLRANFRKRASSDTLLRPTQGNEETASGRAGGGTLTVHCDVIKPQDTQIFDVRPSTTIQEVLSRVLAKYSISVAKVPDYCLGYIKFVKPSKGMSFRGSAVKPKILKIADSPSFLGINDSNGRFELYSVDNIPSQVKAPRPSRQEHDAGSAPATADSKPTAGTPYLLVNCEKYEVVNQIHVISPGINLIGSVASSPADLQLPGKSTKPKHCACVWDNGAATMIAFPDCPVLVDNVKLTKPFLLRDGAVIEVGKSILKFILNGEARAATNADASTMLQRLNLSTSEAVARIRTLSNAAAAAKPLKQSASMSDDEDSPASSPSASGRFSVTRPDVALKVTQQKSQEDIAPLDSFRRSVTAAGASRVGGLPAHKLSISTGSLPAQVPIIITSDAEDGTRPQSRKHSGPHEGSSVKASSSLSRGSVQSRRSSGGDFPDLYDLRATWSTRTVDKDLLPLLEDAIVWRKWRADVLEFALAASGAPSSPSTAENSFSSSPPISKSRSMPSSAKPVSIVVDPEESTQPSSPIRGRHSIATADSRRDRQPADALPHTRGHDAGSSAPVSTISAPRSSLPADHLVGSVPAAASQHREAKSPLTVSASSTEESEAAFGNFGAHGTAPPVLSKLKSRRTPSTNSEGEDYSFEALEKLLSRASAIDLHPQFGHYSDSDEEADPRAAADPSSGQANVATLERKSSSQHSLSQQDQQQHQLQQQQRLHQQQLQQQFQLRKDSMPSDPAASEPGRAPRASQLGAELGARTSTMSPSTHRKSIRLVRAPDVSRTLETCDALAINCTHSTSDRLLTFLCVFLFPGQEHGVIAGSQQESRCLLFARCPPSWFWLL
eukprot:m.607958 g.607958  ORF g.607958 m.607958 type:complete len:838 (-) comp58122_c0_seq3:49-2562(-)